MRVFTYSQHLIVLKTTFSQEYPDPYKQDDRSAYLAYLLLHFSLAELIEFLRLNKV